MWYRGRRNLDAMLSFLKEGYGLGNAEEVREHQQAFSVDTSRQKRFCSTHERIHKLCMIIAPERLLMRAMLLVLIRRVW